MYSIYTNIEPAVRNTSGIVKSRIKDFIGVTGLKVDINKLGGTFQNGIHITDVCTGKLSYAVCIIISLNILTCSIAYDIGHGNIFLIGRSQNLCSE